MKPDFEHIGEKWKGVKLSDASRARIEHELLEYARFHGVEEGVRVREDSRSIKRVPHGIPFIPLTKLRFTHMTAYLLIALLLGGGTSYAAEGAVPGDALYPIKVEVNEEVKSWLAFSNDAEARLQARLVEERLREAEELAARGALTAETKAELSTRMSAHAAEAKTRSERAESQGDLETAASVRASLQGVLASHAHILANMESDADAVVHVSDLMSDIRAIVEGDTSVTVDATVEEEARAEVEATLDAAADILDEAEEAVADAEATLNASVKANAEARLNEATEIYADAKTSFSTEAYAQAYASAEKVMRLSNEVLALVKGALRLNVELDTTTTNSVIKNSINVGANSGGNTSDGEDIVEGDAEVRVETNTTVDSEVIDTTIDASTQNRLNLGL